jgi:hypothetical protein
MRPLPRMRQQVLSQVAGLRERLAARLTDVRSLPRVGPHVLLQTTVRREGLFACLADMSRIHCMRVSFIVTHFIF